MINKKRLKWNKIALTFLNKQQLLEVEGRVGGLVGGQRKFAVWFGITYENF